MFLLEPRYLRVWFGIVRAKALLVSFSSSLLATWFYFHLDPRCRSTSMSCRSPHLPQYSGYQKCAQPLSRSLWLEPSRAISTPPMCTANVVITCVIGKRWKNPHGVSPKEIRREYPLLVSSFVGEGDAWRNTRRSSLCNVKEEFILVSPSYSVTLSLLHGNKR